MARFTSEGASGSVIPVWQPLIDSGVAIHTILDLDEELGIGIALSLVDMSLSIDEALGVALEANITGLAEAHDVLGVSILQIPYTLSPYDYDVGIELTNMIGGVFQSAYAVGTQLTESYALALQTTEGTGNQIVQTVYTLNGDYGATGATSTIVGGSYNWASPANAIGLHDGVDSVLAGELTEVNANLTLTYAGWANKTALTITSVKLVFYTSFTYNGSGSLVMQYSLNSGASYTTLGTLSGSTQAGPFTYDITTAVDGNWTNLNALQTLVSFESPALNTGNKGYCDAVEVLIVATTTQPG